MSFNLKILIEYGSYGISTVMLFYLISNYIFNSSYINIIEMVRGYELKKIDVTLILILTMFLMGLYLGKLLHVGNYLINFILLTIMVSVSISIRENKKIILLNNSYPVQLFLYYILPIIIGISNGSNINIIIKEIYTNPEISVMSFFMIFIMLMSMVLFLGRYRYVFFLSKKKVKVSINNKIIKGILVSETDNEIFLEVDKKSYRYFKKNIEYIIQQ